MMLLNGNKMNNDTYKELESEYGIEQYTENISILHEVFNRLHDSDDEITRSDLEMIIWEFEPQHWSGEWFFNGLFDDEIDPEFIQKWFNVVEVLPEPTPINVAAYVLRFMIQSVENHDEDDEEGVFMSY